MSAPQTAATIKLDPIALLLNASGPIRLTVALLLAAGAAVWLIAVLKFLQTGRLRRAERAFERAGQGAISGQELYSAAVSHQSSPGARIVMALASRSSGASQERLRAIAERALVDERARATLDAVDVGFDRHSLAVHRPVRHGVRDHGRVHSHRSGEERVPSRWWPPPSVKR